MLNIFSNRPKDVKGTRNAILQFIKEQLKKNEGGEGGIIKGLDLFLTCSGTDKHVYEAAVFAGEEDRFKMDEVQRIVDDFDIALPDNWQMTIHYVATAPEEAIKAPHIEAALLIVTNRTKAIHQPATAYILVLNGDTTQPIYTIHSGQGKINIGREEKVQTADGFFRKNYIAFIAGGANTANRTVSRQHAHIEWDATNGSFYLYADEGGIPPNNKIKIRSEGKEPWKLQTTSSGYRLQEGDQVILGESAVLEFSFRSNG